MNSWPPSSLTGALFIYPSCLWHRFCNVPHNERLSPIFRRYKKKQPIFVAITHLKRRMIEQNELLQSIIEGIQEKKGEKITAIRLKGMPGAICDYFVICEGNTPTQVSALADSIEATVQKKRQEKPIRIHGQHLAEWIAIDYGNVMIHIFLPELRSFYNLDNLWDDAQSISIPSIS